MQGRVSLRSFRNDLPIRNIVRGAKEHNIKGFLCHASNVPLPWPTPKCAPAQKGAETPQRSIVQVTPREAKIVENESNINKKVLASAAVVCLATNLLTVQGLLLALYGGALAAVPAGAVRHALKKRNAWPALCILSSIVLIPNIAILRGAYTSVVNPVSVQLKARITLPALVHAFIGSKHPILKGTLQVAQVVSQLVLVGLLLQYLLAPKIAETMRQRAIMLCRALTSTETQALKKERGANGALDAEDWWRPKPSPDKTSPSSSPEFADSITRGKPRPREDTLQRQPRQQHKKVVFTLPEGQQPNIEDSYGHAGVEYAYAHARPRQASSVVSASGGAQLTAFQASDFGDVLEGPSDEEIAQARADLAELGLTFESDNDPIPEATTEGRNPSSPNSELNSVVGSITSTEELFSVLNQQLNMVQDLSDEVRTKGKALRQSEYAREDLLRELKATVGERNEISKELSSLSLKFEAAQSMWEKHLEHGGSISELITDEVLDKVIEALDERKRHLLVDYIDLPLESEDSDVDRDAIASKIRQFAGESLPKQADDFTQNNVQPFDRATNSKEPERKAATATESSDV